MIEKRTYKRTGEEISLLGFGGMRYPTKGDYNNIDTEKASKMIDYAINHGLNYFDTAYFYHGGTSEIFLGDTLSRYPRNSFKLADKMPAREVTTLEDGIRVFKEQLSKCKVDYFDFYLLHGLSDAEKEVCGIFKKTGMLDYLTKQKEAGVIRNFGFSFHGTPEELTKILDLYDWDFVQIQLNYLDWEHQNAKRKYEILTERGLQCIIMEPVRGGTLSTLCPEAVSILKEADPKKSVSSWAIRYAASLPGVLCVLSGMSNMEQVSDNINTMTDFKPLSESERHVIKNALDAYLDTGAVPCTGCRYCMDCPHGVDIPSVFSVYNECATKKGLPVSLLDTKAMTAFNEAYEKLPIEKRAHACRFCKACMEKCPQHIAITDKMNRIARLYEGINTD